MAKLKRKSKPSRVHQAKKKTHKIKVLKKNTTARTHVSAKKHKAAKKPLKKILAKKAIVAHTKAADGKASAKPVKTEDRKGKFAGKLPGKLPGKTVGKPTGKPKGKAGMKSAKQALELLEANVAAAKGKGRPGRKGTKDKWLIPPELPKEDAETRRTRLKNLIKLGKDRGFLTYAEINDHLPDDLVDAEQIEAIISTFGDMGIQVYDQAPDQETLLIASDAAPVAQPDEDVEEQAEAALSTVDSEFGRTTDPVRMYMREMGSVELLTREGEI